MTQPEDFAAPEEHRLEAALDRIASAGSRLRQLPGGPVPAPMRAALAHRIDALIAELRSVLGTEG